MKSPVLVTCALIEKAGKFLLTQRKEDATNGSRWEFPGGKVEHGEAPRKGLERELDEELGITVRAGDVLNISSHSYGELHVVLVAFRCEMLAGEIEKRGIQDYRWVSPEEMRSLDITEADLPFVDKLQASQH